MSACKSHQRQLALLAVDALDERDRPAVLDHLNLCPACREYWKQLQGVVGLYTQDAERSVAVTAKPISTTRRLESTWPKPAMLAAAALFVLCATLLLFRERPDGNSPQPVPITKSSTVTTSNRTLSIADARHLARKDLEELMNLDMAARQQRSDFVFSAGMRHEGP